MTNKQSNEDGTLSDEEINWLTRRAKVAGIVTTAATRRSRGSRLGWRDGRLGRPSIAQFDPFSGWNKPTWSNFLGTNFPWRNALSPRLTGVQPVSAVSIKQAIRIMVRQERLKTQRLGFSRGFCHGGSSL